MSCNLIQIVHPRIISALPAAYGDEYEGGYFAGQIIVDGNLYALVLAPTGLGDQNRQVTRWGTNFSEEQSYTSLHNSMNDGWKNTSQLVAARASTQTLYDRIMTWARSLTINGYTDWYIPARDEWEVIYRNLKPHSGYENSTALRPLQTGEASRANGYNPNSSPVGTAYTAAVPASTNHRLFRYGGEQSVLMPSGPTNYWTSSARVYGSAPLEVWCQDVLQGGQLTVVKRGSQYGARAVRRVLLGPAS